MMTLLGYAYLGLYIVELAIAAGVAVVIVGKLTGAIK